LLLCLITLMTEHMIIVVVDLDARRSMDETNSANTGAIVNPSKAIAT
jgi:hypothetical protein